MEIDLLKYASEIVDFLNGDTLREIDYGILDLSRVGDIELRDVLFYLEELLAVELELNYRQNGTGMFRVYNFGSIWCYCEGEYVVSAYSACELKECVISDNRIWYVFDENLAARQLG